MLRYFEGNSWNSPIFATMITTALYLLTLLCISLFFGKVAIGQEVTIELGADQLGLNETFTIKVTLSNEKIKSYDQFPEIQ